MGHKMLLPSEHYANEHFAPAAGKVGIVRIFPLELFSHYYIGLDFSTVKSRFLID